MRNTLRRLCSTLAQLSLDDPRDQVATSADFISRNKIDTGVPFIDNGLKKAFANPALVLYKLQANAYKFAWALIPLSLPFLWLLYPFSRRFHAYDHFVFVTYSISFMLLLFVVVRLLNLTIFGEVATFLAMLYVPFHMYRQLRGAYRSSRPPRHPIFHPLGLSSRALPRSSSGTSPSSRFQPCDRSAIASSAPPTSASRWSDESETPAG